MLSKGDEVRVLNEDAAGVVKAVLPDGMVVVDIEGFDYNYQPHELIAIRPDGSVAFQSRSFEDSPEEVEEHRHAPVPKHFDIDVFKRVSRRGLPEVDLHFHELVEDEWRYNKEERLELQIRYLREFVEHAIAKRVSEIIVIHGVGEGILRTEVRRFLESLGSEVWDASYKEYGYGATRVKI